MEIIKPTLIINKTICQQNIKRMTEKAKSHNIDFRPHFKTHQSPMVGDSFKNFAVNKINALALFYSAYPFDDWGKIAKIKVEKSPKYKSVKGFMSLSLKHYEKEKKLEKQNKRDF